MTTKIVFITLGLTLGCATATMAQVPVKKGEAAPLEEPKEKTKANPGHKKSKGATDRIDVRDQSKPEDKKANSRPINSNNDKATLPKTSTKQ